MQKVSSKRIITFDLLRGFFILVIIIDHLQRWPGIFDWLTGQGRLWVSAAEGFILISGIMIGLIRGYKDKPLPLWSVTKKLWKRAFILYIWAAIVSVISLLIIRSWQANYVPFPPGMDTITSNNWLENILSFLTYRGVFGWSIFLGVYAVFLFASPMVIYLLRKNKWWLILIISFIIWAIGLGQKNMLLSWQLLFFGGAIFGYYYNTLNEWFQRYKYKNAVRVITLSAFLISLLASVLIIFGWPFIKSGFSPVSLNDFIEFRSKFDPLFLREELRPAHMLATAIWFGGLLIIFGKFQKQIYKYFGWLLLPFGRHSLFVYITQGFVAILVAGLIPLTTNIILNALITTCSVMILWLIIKIKFLHKIIPS